MNVNIDGITISLNDLLTALKRQGSTRLQLRQAQVARSKKFGIAVLGNAALTIPARLARLGVVEADFADPVNFAFPVWLSKPDRDALSRAQLGQVQNAGPRFAQFSDRYDSKSRAVVERRIQQARRKFGIAQKSWDCTIAKVDEEKQIVYGVALRPDVRDSQGDKVTPEEIEIAAHGFMSNSRKGDLQHQVTLPENDFVIVESHIARVDEPPHIVKGDWVVGAKLSDGLWKLVKEGKVNGFSIKGRGLRVSATS